MIALPRTTTKDPTPSMGVDTNDVRAIHEAIGRYRRITRRALWISALALATATVAVAIAVFALITKGS